MRKIIPVVAAGAALAVVGTSVAYASLDKDVTVSVDGQARTLQTRAGTVGELLADQGLTVSDRDVVAPAASSKVSDGTRIAVQFARPVTFTVDGKRRTVWTTATSLDAALGALGVNTSGADLSTSRSTAIGRQGLSVDVATLKAVTVKAAGKKRTVKTTGATVGQALAAARITVDGNDKVTPKTSTKLVAGAAITYTRVGVSTDKKKERVSFTTVRKNSGSLERGKTRVDTEGRSGSRTLTYRVVREDGQVTSRKKTATTLTRQPRTEVVLVGTKAPKATTSGGASGGVWDRIAACESGGNWSISTGNGFYGGLQFTMSTWHAYGGSGNPANASKSAQIAVAQKVQAAQGWGAWPACTSKLGLR
ncbi:ubiquitin-like domain-containing protein [uncultured Friedmanniella sp.]|uniref:ubiquitin-like domain-containing protein n=1 Tax=uncultured Friedmanniella sp. TaxID=335381 RepID=UPI0035CC58FF